MSTVVVYIHGLWFRGGESLLLRRRLSRTLGAECRVFPYSSVGGEFAENVAALGRYLRAVGADTVHLVAHSLGGLLLTQLFETEAGSGTARELPPGRVVLIGSPVQGSRSAQRLQRLPMGSALLGRTGGELTLGTQRRWSGGRDLGVIAGVLPIGLGKLLGRLDGPNDGTVAVKETDLPGAAERLLLRVSHTGLVYSPEVARQAAAFLRDGRFARS
jgi:pimeloyl-ACP methyl ester carboxylesterase